MTPVERVLVLKSADLLKDVGPRHLLGLAERTSEVEIWKNDTIYREEDPADALYIVVEGRVRLSIGERVLSEVGAGEAFGSWSLVDDSARGQRADCVEDGLVLALPRDEFYEVASGDLTLLQQIVRVLAKRLRALAADAPEQARVEGEGVEKPEALSTPEEGAQAGQPTESDSPPAAATPASPAEALKAAVLGRPAPEGPVAAESPGEVIPAPEPTGPTGPKTP